MEPVDNSVLLVAILFKIATAALVCFSVWLVARILDKLGTIQFSILFKGAQPNTKLAYLCSRPLSR